jgi:LacI family transcriptional regulator
MGHIMAGEKVEAIAREVGVSPRTVQRILSEPLRDRRPTIVRRAERIRELALAMNYRPNAAARATRKGRFGNVALVLSAAGEGRSTLPDGLLAGITHALDERNLHLTVARLADERLTDAAYVPKILREWMCDGLLINYNKRVPNRMVDLLERYHLPSIWLNCKRDSDCAYPDDLAAGREATRRLLALGHRRIAYVSYSYKTESLHYSELDRRDGYLAAMQEAGLTPESLDRYNSPSATFAQRTETWAGILARPDRPTAAISYGLPEHIVRAAERVGLAIPQDLSLVAFAGQVAFVGEEVATMLVPDAEVGRAGVEMLLEKIGTPQAALAPRAIPFGFAEGRTLAPPPPNKGKNTRRGRASAERFRAR